MLFHMTCRQYFCEPRLVIWGLRFGTIWAVKLAGTDQDPVPDCPGLPGPGQSGTGFGPFTLALRPKSAKTEDQKLQVLCNESLVGKPYELWPLRLLPKSLQACYLGLEHKSTHEISEPRWWPMRHSSARAKSEVAKRLGETERSGFWSWCWPQRPPPVAEGDAGGNKL